MKLTTIWTLRAMTFRARLALTREWLAMRVAVRLPLRVRYWVTILELGAATMDSENVPATTLNDIMKNLQHPKRVA